MEKGKSHKSAKKKSIRKHGVSKRRKRNDSGSDENVDISEKVFPISHYINDREEMLKQAFSVIEKEKLNCMLPPVLKGLSIQSLMSSCLKELKSMSDDEVFKVLRGESSNMPTDKEPALLRTVSESKESVSSAENNCSEEQEKRTLLDILEQEMQEIAYNTVLSRNKESPLTISDGEFPEIVAITPHHSPSRSKNTVPLICIDSEEDERDVHIVAKEPGDNTANKHPTVNREKEDMSRRPLISVSSLPENTEVNLGNRLSATDKFNKLTEDQSDQTNAPASTTASLSGSKAQESFVIQVFSDTPCMSERIVKKVFQPTCLEEVPYKSVDCSNDNKEKSPISQSRHTEGKNQEGLDVIDKIMITEDQAVAKCLQPQMESNVAPVHSSSQTSSNSQTVETCGSLTNSNPLSKQSCFENSFQNQSAPTLVQEKEEGEISSESDNDIEIIGTVGDTLRSPTVLLSSSESDSKNKMGRCASEISVRKHHKHRRRKRNPDESTRIIDKRGNRSYRRKISPPKELSPSPIAMKCSIEEIPLPAAESSHTNVLPGNFHKETSDLSLSNDSNAPQTLADLSSTTLIISEAGTDEQNNSTMETSLEEVDAVSSKSKGSPIRLENSQCESKLDSGEEEQSDGCETLSAKTSWADRWAQKKDMKKVVITSKICRTVRKKILSARQKKASLEKPSAVTAALPPVPPLVLHVEGSVQEYQMLQFLVSDTEHVTKVSSSSEFVEQQGDVDSLRKSASSDAEVLDPKEPH